MRAAGGSVVVAVALAGCGGAAAGEPSTVRTPDGALAVVVGARANMPTPVLAGRSASIAATAVAQDHEVSLVVADGAPHVEPVFPGGEVADAETMGQALAGVRAVVPETDLLGALGVAAQELAGDPGLRTVLVMDSGLSTSGALDFTAAGMLDAHPVEVAEALSDARLLPDLTGVGVVFHGLGDVAAPQQQLDPIRRAQLVAIWRAVVLEAGARSVDVENTPLVGDPPAGLPAVATVPIGPGYRCEGTVMTITGGPFAFRPNGDEFIDRAAATDVLRGIAEQLRAGGGEATLFGTTAAIGEPADQVRFSDQRAQAVADVLIELDVPLPQLHVEGLGSDWPGYVLDRGPDGNLLPAAAALNRTIRIEFSAPVTC